MWTTLCRRRSDQYPSVAIVAGGGVALSGCLFKVVQRECRRLERRVFGFDPYDEGKVDYWLATRSINMLRLDLVSALESLPERYCEVILLRDFSGMAIKAQSERTSMGVVPLSLSAFPMFNATWIILLLVMWRPSKELAE